jgi:replication initiation and membrane attachment protein
MHKVSILPADTYMVINKTIINDIDRKNLIMLYQPLLGSLPINLYLNLWSDLDKAEIMSIEYTHHHLMTMMQIKIEDIKDAREKLEALGLIKTYLKKGSINSYVYELYSPLNASEFLNHPLLNVLLYSQIGKKEYDKLTNYYLLPKVNLNDFEDITVHFSDIYNVNASNLINNKEDLKERKISDIKIDNDIDFNFIIDSLPKGFINTKAFDQSTKKLISNLSFLYKIDINHMIDIIRSCINEKGSIDKIKLRTACRNYYQFENDNELPNLIYRSQPEILKSTNNDGSKRASVIYTFETLSPYDFLRGKYNGGIPTNRDIKLVEDLMVEQNLNPGVVNVLIDYVLKINANKLSKNFIETIAGQWKRLNIKTVEEAMSQAEKEHKKYQKQVVEKVKKIDNEKTPDWFNKEITSKKLPEERAKVIRDIINKRS